MKLHFQASPAESAQRALAEFSGRYGQATSPAEADVLVALGGDGRTLHTLQDAIRYKKPVFGLNFGHVGFLQNLHEGEKDLIDRIEAAERITLSPFKIEAEFLGGDIRKDFAVNEVHICNHNRAEGIYMRVLLDGQERISRLGGDGLLISTTVGSTGYNRSAHGSILPLGDDLIILTPNNAFMPMRMMSSAVIRPCPIIVEIIDPEYRKTDVYADNRLIGETATRISAELDKEHAYQLLFDAGYSLHERIMRTQFPKQQLG